MTTYPPLADRFWSRVQKTDGCWLWTGATSGHGYGQLHHEGKTVYAHRVAWHLATGSKPIGHVCHHCDTPACVRFDHLFQGDHKANADDMAAKGRWRNQHVETTHCKRGHPLSGANLLIRPNAFDGPGRDRTYRACRECQRLGAQRRAS